MIEGWSHDDSISKGHYFKQVGKKFWNYYPPDESPTGFTRPEEYYYKYQSLCGKDSFVRPVKPSKRSGFGVLKFSMTVKNPCIICLKRLAKQRGLI